VGAGGTASANATSTDQNNNAQAYGGIGGKRWPQLISYRTGAAPRGGWRRIRDERGAIKGATSHIFYEDTSHGGSPGAGGYRRPGSEAADLNYRGLARWRRRQRVGMRRVAV